MNVLDIIGGITAIIGALFLFLGALGIVRMPDVFNRIQAGTKATTLGTLLFLLGLALGKPEWFPRLIVLMLFIVLTNPVSSHVLARAAHFIKVKMSDRTIGDKLREYHDGAAVADEGVSAESTEEVGNA